MMKEKIKELEETIKSLREYKAKYETSDTDLIEARRINNVAERQVQVS